MMMKTEFWDSFAGEERAIWPIDELDSVGSVFWGTGNWDSDEDSDYDVDDDDDNKGGGRRKASGIRVLNPPPDGYDPLDVILGAGCTIYPGQDHPNCIYRHAHLHDFSRKAINQYNHQTGSTYEFVELVKASVVTTAVEADYILVTFKACQSNVTTSFKAEAHSASKSLTASYDIETVVPLHSDDSDMSSASGSESHVI